MKKIFPLLVILTGIILSFLVYKNINNVKEHHRTETAKKALDILEGELNSILKNRFFVSEAMKSYITINPDIDSGEFGVFARTLLSANSPIRAIQYADPDTRVIYVYPPVGNKITITNPMVLIKDQKRGKYVKKAINEKSATLQPPFELRQGGVGMVLRNPIFIDDAFYGLSIIVLDVDAIFEELYSNNAFEDYEIGYYSEGALFSGKDLSDPEVLSRKIAVADTIWEIRLLNIEETIDYQTHVMLLLLLLIFIGIAVILFILMNRGDYLTKQVEIETAHLTETNQELEKQILLRTKSEEQTVKLLAEKELLLKEIHHRLKNNLNSIRSLILLQISQSNNIEISDSLKLTISRLDSLKELYERLLETEDFIQLNVSDYLNNLVTSIKKTIDRNDEIIFHIDLDDFLLDTKILFPLGIITNELITNSVKYAFPKDYGGEITISLKNKRNSFMYTILDNGIGNVQKEEFQEHSGFGLSLVKMLVGQLNGTFSTSSSNGYRYSINVPLEIIN